MAARIKRIGDIFRPVIEDSIDMKECLKNLGY
jgi:hypothetical protein